jgi:predicted acyl esterase
VHPSVDRAWHRPGATAYARQRFGNVLRPPVTVYAAPSDLIKDRDVPVTMRDGVTLRVNVYRPAGEGPFPVIVSAHPYGKDRLSRRTRSGWSFNFQYRIMNQASPVRISSETGWEAPDPVPWVEQGYVVINADTRGAGTSQGTGAVLSDQEAQDIYELLEWAGAQPWSSGNVGMLGVSYLAISQYKVAALSPPSLKAICPWEGFTDAYRDFMTPGGVVENGFSMVWQFATKRAARLSVDLGKERPKHPLRDGWWEAITPDLAKIEVPMLVCASFSDGNLHSSGSMRAFEETNSKDKHVYMHRGPKWATFYGNEARTAQLKFFDRFLKDQPGAPIPRVRLEVRESRDQIAQVRSEHEWPLARTDWRNLYLSNDSVLAGVPGRAGSVTFDLRRSAAKFVVDFIEDTEITGPMSLRLWASISGATDASLFVGVEKWSGNRYIPFEGSYGYGRDRMAAGRQRLSLRKLDPDLSKPHRPEHDFVNPESVGTQPVELQIPLTASSTLFRAGDSLRLLVGGRYLEPRNPLFGHFPTHYRPSSTGRCTLHWSDIMPAVLELPFIRDKQAVDSGKQQYIGDVSPT